MPVVSAAKQRGIKPQAERHHKGDATACGREPPQITGRKGATSPFPPHGASPAGLRNQPHPPFSKQQLLNHKRIRPPGHVPKAREHRRIQDIHELGHPHRRAHLSRRVEGANRPTAHARDGAQVGIASPAGDRALTRGCRCLAVRPLVSGRA
eukprot:349893-Chlamydomonas_euryale.AAC.5